MKTKILYIVIILGGIGLLLYPWISNWLFQHQAGSEVTAYQTESKTKSEEEKEEMLRKAEEYNKNLNQSQVQLTDPFVEDVQQEKEGLEYNSLLNMMGNGMMGYIEIPAISVSLPIYHGTAAATLEKGIGHLEGSSLPVGGEGTHSVLTGHTGLNKAKLFTDLTELKKGDYFFLYVAGRDMAYQVEEIQVVRPEDISSLLVRPGEDLVTLVTCTPYGVNTHRLCVTGRRTDYSVHDDAVQKGNTVKDSIWMHTYRRAVVVGLAVSIVIIILLRIIRRLKYRWD